MGTIDELRGRDFIREIVANDLEQGRHKTVVMRFPPEPNGYLHIGHAKAICVDFGIAADVPGGRCHLRMDDTNPTVEKVEYVQSIQTDIRWLGFEWGDHMHYASDHFGQLYAWAEELVGKGLAYVCHQNEEEMRATRGTVLEDGSHSPDRDRTPAENLDLLRRMKAGEFSDGHCTLRAKIDMASPNMKMRDPPMYRIRHAHHHRTGDDWCIYPIYDFAHGLSDANEGITHSICTLEFENNRELYDWYVAHVTTTCVPRQYEMARLNITHVMLSKRKLIQLVTDGHVNGWDDPRMPTLSGLRRRGVTATAIRAFCERVGVAKTNSLVEMALFEHTVRDELNTEAPRVMAVVDPLKVVLTGWPVDKVDTLEASLWPHDVPKEGTRPVPFTRELFIERSDFMEVPAKGFRRLSPGVEVRLRYGYLVTCTDVVKGSDGEIVEIHCTHDPDSRGGKAPDGRKVKGTIHWVSATEGVPARAHIYDHLFTAEEPGKRTGDPLDDLNPDSLDIREAILEPWAAAQPPGSRLQFERLGYFFRDPEVEELRFNLTVALKDKWARKKAAPVVEAPAAPVTAPDDKRRRKRARGAQRDAARAANPVLAGAYARLVGELGLPETEVRVITDNEARVAFFEAALGAHPDPHAVAKWMVNRLIGKLSGDQLAALSFDGGAFGRLVALVSGGEIPGSIGGRVLEEMVTSGGEPAEIIERLGLKPVSDEGELRTIIQGVMDDHADAVARYRAGNQGLRGFFVGQVMQKTGGKADPRVAAKLIGELLG